MTKHKLFRHQLTIMLQVKNFLPVLNLESFNNKLDADIFTGLFWTRIGYNRGSSNEE
jgi:hypothetical protein